MGTKRFSVLLLVVVASWSCGSTPEDPFDVGFVLAHARGTVSSEAGAPIAGARVTANILDEQCDQWRFFGGEVGTTGELGVFAEDFGVPLTSPFTGCVVLLSVIARGTGVDSATVTVPGIRFRVTVIDTVAVELVH